MRLSEASGATYIVWRHHEGKVMALGEWSERELADAYAKFCNGRSHAAWCEVRSNEGGSEPLAVLRTRDPRESPR